MLVCNLFCASASKTYVVNSVYLHFFDLLFLEMFQKPRSNEAMLKWLEKYKTLAKHSNAIQDTHEEIDALMNSLDIIQANLNERQSYLEQTLLNDNNEKSQKKMESNNDEFEFAKPAPKKITTKTQQKKQQTLNENKSENHNNYNKPKIGFVNQSQKINNDCNKYHACTAKIQEEYWKIGSKINKSQLKIHNNTHVYIYLCQTFFNCDNFCIVTVGCITNVFQKKIKTPKNTNTHTHTHTQHGQCCKKMERLQQIHG